jgi:hypothetical protein
MKCILVRYGGSSLNKIYKILIKNNKLTNSLFEGHLRVNNGYRSSFKGFNQLNGLSSFVSKIISKPLVSLRLYHNIGYSGAGLKVR